jgi:hypothetical protein
MGDTIVAAAFDKLSTSVDEAVSNHTVHTDALDQLACSLEECVMCMHPIASLSSTLDAMVESRTPSDLRALWTWLVSAIEDIPVGMLLALLKISITLLQKMVFVIRSKSGDGRHAPVGSMPVGSPERCVFMCFMFVRRVVNASTTRPPHHLLAGP